MGWRPTVHAAGDAAVAEVLSGFAVADAPSSIRVKRWTIEHAALTNPALTQQMHRLGVQISVQHHMYLAGPLVARSEEHTTDITSQMRNSYAVFCWKTNT